MAWADGVIADAERAAMNRLIAIAELSDEERATAKSWLETPVDFDLAQISVLSPAAKTGIYRAAARLAMVDLDFAEEEKKVLARLREGLGLSEDEAAELEKSLAPS